MTAVLATASSFQTTPTLTVVATPADVTGYSNTGAVANITTGSVVLTPTGGVSPYTYAWVQSGASPYIWVIVSAAAASTGFTANAVGAGNTAEAAFRGTVTDSAGKTATATVAAFANNGLPYDNRVGRDFLDRSNA